VIGFGLFRKVGCDQKSKRFVVLAPPGIRFPEKRIAERSVSLSRALGFATDFFQEPIQQRYDI